MLPGGYGEAIWRVWEGCLEGVVILPGGCGEAVWRVWGGCLDVVEILPGGCGEAVWRVWGGCLEGLGWLSVWSGRMSRNEMWQWLSKNVKTILCLTWSDA